MYNKGSEWRKWDLHVHTPASLDHKYGSNDETTWEKYIRDLENLPDSPHCQNSCHPHLNNPNGEKGDNHGTIQCRTQTGYTKQTFIT